MAGNLITSQALACGWSQDWIITQGPYWNAQAQAAADESVEVAGGPQPGTGVGVTDAVGTGAGGAGAVGAGAGRTGGGGAGVRASQDMTMGLSQVMAALSMGGQAPV